MSQLREAERIYRQTRTAAKQRTLFTLKWEFGRVGRMAAGSTDATVLARLAALRDELIARGELAS